MANGQEVSRQRVKITGIQLVEQGDQQSVTLSMVDAPAAQEPRTVRTRGGRMIPPDPMAGNGTGYTRTVPLDDENPYKPGEIMTIVTIRGDEAGQVDDEEEV